MFTLIDLMCKNPACEQEPYEELLTKEELKKGIKCPLCGKKMKIDTLNRPRHARHLSWSKWRVDLGD
jgi:hypothetical protein